MKIREYIYKGFLASSLLLGIGFCIYVVTSVIFIMTLFETNDHPEQKKATQYDAIFKDVPGGAVTDRKLTDELAPVENKKSGQQIAPDTSSVAGHAEQKARQEQLEQLVQASMTNPDEIIVPPSEDNDWKGVTRGELEVRHERLDWEIFASMTDPNETIIPASEDNDGREVRRGELEIRHERLDAEINASMNDPAEMIILPSEDNDWQGVTRGELAARHKRLDTEIEQSSKNPPIMVFPGAESEK